MADEKGYYTTREVAERLEISRQAVHAAAERGDIPGRYRFLHRWRFKRKDVDSFIAAGGLETKPASKRSKRSK